jgi:hypothetical protein
MTKPYTPPRDLDDAVAAARGWEPSEIFARMHTAREQAARRVRRRRVARIVTVCAAAGVVVALLTTAVWPETWQGQPYGSTVTLRPSAEPGAVAELFFDNTGVDNGGRIRHTFTLGGHHIEAELGLPEYPDTIRVMPADGYIAVPDVLTIPDGTTGVVLIYRIEAVGM